MGQGRGRVCCTACHLAVPSCPLQVRAPPRVRRARPAAAPSPSRSAAHLARKLALGWVAVETFCAKHRRGLELPVRRGLSAAAGGRAGRRRPSEGAGKAPRCLDGAARGRLAAPGAHLTVRCSGTPALGGRSGDADNLSWWKPAETAVLLSRVRALVRRRAAKQPRGCASTALARHVDASSPQEKAIGKRATVRGVRYLLRLIHLGVSVSTGSVLAVGDQSPAQSRYARPRPRPAKPQASKLAASFCFSTLPRNPRLLRVFVSRRVQISPLQATCSSTAARHGRAPGRGAVDAEAGGDRSAAAGAQQPRPEWGLRADQGGALRAPR
jgi:hypothetical protein